MGLGLGRHMDEALDRHITRNYGEDNVDAEEDEKVFYFTVSGKIQAKNESEAGDLIFELLDGKCQFQITKLEGGEEWQEN